MRIIAGKHRGRKLLPPEGDLTRPITDRVKQSLFDILQPRLAGSRVYDCFAGTGSMGLECLSRDTVTVSFFEADRSALSRLQRNIEAIDAKDRATIVRGDLFQWFDRQAALVDEARIDLVFLDPPYRFLTERPQDLKHLALRMAARHLAKEGLVIFRHQAEMSLSLEGLVKVDQRDYGSMSIEFLKPVHPTVS
ncbi:MAG TPA: 16S rRNA (guanine(966)-N(2))-methyltransferase RsmD [Tepidisphaeraceae bacterium]|nr:16S rRNA (guanine(966)-N(2))-methyltransferase RsmD [Tepidisphaeraceae bacterium]